MSGNVKDAVIGLALILGAGIYMLLRAVYNTKGLIINHIIRLNVDQANVFYLGLGLLLVICGIGAAIIMYKSYRGSW